MLQNSKLKIYFLKKLNDQFYLWENGVMNNEQQGFFYSVCRVAPFFFLMVEVMAFINPDLWEGRYDTQNIINTALFIWGVYVMRRLSSSWGILFIMQLAVGYLVFHEHHPTAIEIKAVVVSCFIIYEIMIIEAGCFYFNVVERVVNKGSLISILLMEWYSRCLQQKLEYDTRRFVESGVDPKAIALTAFLTFYIASYRKSTKTKVIFSEVNTDNVSIESSEDAQGETNFRFSANKRILEIAKIALEKAKEGKEAEAYAFVVNHSEMRAK